MNEVNWQLELQLAEALSRIHCRCPRSMTWGGVCGFCERLAWQIVVGEDCPAEDFGETEGSEFEWGSQPIVWQA